MYPNLWCEFNYSSFNFGVEGQRLEVHDGGLFAQLGFLRHVGRQVVASIFGQLANNA